MKTLHPYVTLVFATGFFAAAQQAGSAQAEAWQQDEGPWQGGVFDNRNTSIPAPPEPLAIAPEPLLFDADGNANELVLMPDYADGSFVRNAVPSIVKGTSWRPEDILIHAINVKDSTAHAALGNPTKGARHLIEEDRLGDSGRQRLAGDDPLERLHRYVLLHYPTVAAAQRAERLLKGTAGIAYVALGRKGEFSFAPNDPFFQVKSDATKYQWGMHAMNFPAAWDKTKGHGYWA